MDAGQKKLWSKFLIIFFWKFILECWELGKRKILKNKIENINLCRSWNLNEEILG
jgi:hypothetical protein